MATRKSGDGSRGMEDGGSDRPGSYAKTIGSRRKRKGKNRRSTVPPGMASSQPSGLSDESAEQRIASSAPPRESSGFDDALDVEGVEVARTERGRLTQPEWGGGANDNSVDDLRRKPTSSRAPRKQLGPLGMDEASAEDPAHSSAPAPRRLSTPRPSAPSGRMNVVEIDATEQTSDNNNDSYDHGSYDHGSYDHGSYDHGSYETHESFEPSGNPFGDPFENEPVESEPPRRERSAAASAHTARPSPRPSREQLALEAAWREADAPARPSLSSVFGARASLHPSPPPPAANSVSILWWVVVTLLSGIIIAAGVIALREAQHAEESARAPGGAPVSGARPTEPTAAPPLRLAPASTTALEPAAAKVESHAPLPSAPAPGAAAPSAPTLATPAVVAAPGPGPVPAKLAPVAPVAVAKPARVAPPMPPAPSKPAPGATSAKPAVAPHVAARKPSTRGMQVSPIWEEAPPAPVVTPLPDATPVRAPAEHSAAEASPEPQPRQNAELVQQPVITPPPEPRPEPKTPNERLPQNPYN